MQAQVLLPMLVQRRREQLLATQTVSKVVEVAVEEAVAVAVVEEVEEERRSSG